MDCEYSWTQENIFQLIEARSKFKVDFNNTPEFVYQHIINELGLTNKVSVKSASRLWESLITKYKELSQPALEPEDAAPPSWQYFEAVHNALLSLPPTIMEMGTSPIDINTSSKIEIPLNAHGSIVELRKENEHSLMKVNESSCESSHKHPNEESYKGIQNELMAGPQEDSQEEFEDSRDASHIALNEDSNEEAREETFEEEAARLEEAFRNGNIVTIESLVEDVEEEEEKVVIDVSDVDEECIDDGADVEQMEEIQEGEEEEEKTSNYVDHIWTREKIFEFISLRGEREADVISIGHRPVFMQMLEELGLSTLSTPSEARKKWSSLVRKYFQIKAKFGKEAGHSSDDFQVSWPFFEAMEKVMEKIIKTSPDGGMKLRRSPEYHWGTDITKKFIRLRLEKQPEISLKGHNAVYQDILEKLQIDGKVSVMMARKKWNYLVKRYQDEELAGGERTWIFMKDMRQVMKYFRSCNPTKLRTRASPEFLWPNDLTKDFIKLRVARYEYFIEGGYQNTYTDIMEQLGLEHILTPNHLRKKWNYLVSKYRELSCSTGPDGTYPAPHSWPFFEDMQKAMKLIPHHLLSSSKIIRVNYENIWTKDVLLKFIELKGKKSAKSPKKLCLVFTEIIEELGLVNQITPHQARKKWNYLYNKYLDLSHPEVDEFVRKSWPYYTAMQDAVGSLPISQTLNKKCIGDELEGDEDDSGIKQYQRKLRSYTCFLCGKIGRILNDFFMFENNQFLLHTQRNVLDIIAHLIGEKVMNFSSTTCLCSDCTNLVNEADNVIFRHEKIKIKAKKLYNNSNHSRMSNDKVDKDSSNQKNSSLPQENLDSQETVDFSEEIEKEFENQVNGKEEIKVSEQKVSYSKRGRKRKHIVRNDGAYLGIKSEPVDDVYESTECENDHDEEYVDERKKMKLKGRGRGRGKKKKRGRPAKIARTTLVGKGLGGLYQSSNKRKPLNFKGPKIYHCSECKGEFKKYMDLINHKREVHTVIDTSTLEVEETVLDNGVITYFNKGKANNSETCHPCRDCNKQFLRKDDLWYHQEIAHTEGKGRTKTAFKDRSYDCEECGEKFLFKYKLKMHINSKHLNDAGKNANDFTCGECGCKLGSLPGLTFHMRKHHNKSLTYRKTTEYLCSDCGFLAASNKKLKEHHESHCGSTTKPKVQCEICGKTVLKVSLKMHKIKMHSEFKEQCDRCGERCATKTDLLRHINVVHLRILLYSCRYCNERFPTSDALRYHRVKVHEKPSFFCQICGKCYKRVGELNTHIKRAHNDRKKGEVCHYCFKEYYDRSGLRTHLVNKHDVPQEMTYSENYMRKKRVDGLPLAKHMEKKGIMDTKMMADGRMMSSVIQSPILHHQLQPGHQQHQQHQQHQHQQQQSQTHLASQQLAILHHHPHVQQQQLPAAHMAPAAEQHAPDEAAEAARNLSNTYHEMSNAEEEGSLVVTEITESPQVEQTVLVDPLSGTQAFLPHPAHMQPMAAHHHIHQQVNYQANMRLNLFCQMNIQNPGPSHLNM